MDQPNGNSFAQQRRSQSRTPANLRLVTLGIRELGFELSCEVTNMYGPTVHHGATTNGATADGYSPLANGHGMRYRSVRSDQLKNVIIETKNCRIFGATNTRSILCDHIQNRLNISRRSRDDP